MKAKEIDPNLALLSFFLTFFGWCSSSMSGKDGKKGEMRQRRLPYEGFIQHSQIHVCTPPPTVLFTPHTTTPHPPYPLLTPHHTTHTLHTPPPPTTPFSPHTPPHPHTPDPLTPHTMTEKALSKEKENEKDLNETICV